MRFRVMLFAVVTALALSGAPAHASPGCPSGDGDCTGLLPSYWQDPTQPCPLTGCDWLVVAVNP